MAILCKHCVKSVCIRSYSGPHFPTFGMNTERYGVSLRIQSEYGKMRTRMTPNMDIFYAVKTAYSNKYQIFTFKKKQAGHKNIFKKHNRIMRYMWCEYSDGHKQYLLRARSISLITVSNMATFFSISSELYNTSFQ